MIYKNALITTKDQQFLGWIEVDNQEQIIKSINCGATDLDGYDCQGNIIMPAFIDSHIHGGYDLSFNDFDNFDNYQNFLENLKSEGICAFVGASVTAPLDVLNQSLNKIKYLLNYPNQINLPKMVGWYFEGPFISKSKKGAHEEGLIVPIDEQFLMNLKANLNQWPIVITVAPEEADNQSLIEKYQNDFIFALGHSDANALVAKQALKNGIKRVTHFYNAMSGFHHSNQAGIVNTLFNKDLAKNALIELIADGIHVNPEVINFTFEHFGANNLCLVTDALPAKGLPDQSYYLANLEIDKRGNWFYLANSNVLAGSALRYNDLLKIFKKTTNCSWMDLVKLSSYNAARNLNLENYYGNLIVDQKALFVIVDHDLNIIKTII